MKEEDKNLRKFISKFRYWLALLIIVLAISNVSAPNAHSNASVGGIHTLGTGEWNVETN